jgi:sugar lactone lactonase YvrE
MDRNGHLYVGDYNNQRIRKITPEGVVSTLAGSGGTGFNDGTGGSATFHFPSAVALDSSGNVYVADYNNHLIRKVSPAGVVTRLAGAGTYGNVNGSGATAKFDSPYGVAVDTSGNAYVADESNHQIRKITPEGMVSTLAGTGTAGFEDGTGISAKFNYPSGVALDTNGNLYVADASNNRIRKITQAGVVSTLAGMGSSGAVNGAGVTATFGNPSGVALDNNGNVYVADYNNHLIRMISPAGVVSTLAGVELVGHLDGLGVTAKFNHPSGVALDTSGNVYVADSNNNRIRKITPIF